MRRNLTPDMFSVQDVERFWSNVKIGRDDECWPWQSHLDGHGYGIFFIGQKRFAAHRIALTLSIGGLNAALNSCHSCDTPICCNPRHLFAGTQADNIQDMIRKGRDGCLTKNKLSGDRHWMRKKPELIARGERANKSALTEADIRAIRGEYQPQAKGANLYDLSRKYGISATTICNIVNRKTWKHVE
jgi:hypothetical protein